MADGAIRAIVLDVNGTLAQDDHLVAPLYVQGFAAAGTELTVEEYHREFAATPDHLAFSEAIRRSGRPVEAAERDALVAARRQGYLAAVAMEPPIAEHARAFVRTATARGVRLAITSGAFREEIEHVLRVAGIDTHFDTVVAIDDVRHGKPHPEGFTRALDQINALATPEAPIAAHEVVAVEDATEGAEAARCRYARRRDSRAWLRPGVAARRDDHRATRRRRTRADAGVGSERTKCQWTLTLPGCSSRSRDSPALT